MQGLYTENYRIFLRKLKHKYMEKHILFMNQKNPFLVIKKSVLEQDGRGVSGRGVHLSPRIRQEYTFRHRSACRTPAERGQEYLTSGKEYIEPHKTWQDKGTRGKKQECQQAWTCPQWVGELKQGSDPHIRAIV